MPATPSGAWRWLMPLCALALLPALGRALWSDSVDLAHHYALAARLAQHWTLPGTADPSLGEMNVYPHLSHVLAALAGRLAGSPLLGLHLSAQAALLAVWIGLLSMLRALPPRAALYGGLALAVLLPLAHCTLHPELHGGELILNYFYSQLVGQAVVVLAALAALQLERRATPPWWRHALLAGAAYLCTGIHLLPAAELLVLLVLLALSDLRGTSPRAVLARVAPALLLAAVTAVLVWRHPAFAVMKSISNHNGQMNTAFLGTRAALGAYAAALAALSLLLLRHWRRRPDAQLALGQKYLALLGLATALLCLAQLGALLLGSGSDYATQKYAFGLNTLMLLELCLLPALLAPPARAASPLMPALALIWPALLVLATLGLLPRRAPVAVAPLVQAEQQLLQWRDVYQSDSAQRHSWVSGVPGLSPGSAYLFSIGLLASPRDLNANAVLAGGTPADLRLVSTLITGADTLYGQQRECRRNGSTARWVMLDGDCLDRWQHPPGSRIGLRLQDGEPLCRLQGFSVAETYGRWSAAPQASIVCPVPLLHGARARGVALTAQPFLDHVPQQRVSIRVNGGAARDFLWSTPGERTLELPLPADASGELTLTLALPDARAPVALGLGSDARQLGILLQQIEFH